MSEKVSYNDLPDLSSPIPAGLYTVLVQSIDQSPSKKHAPMDTLELEVLAPDFVEHAGAKVQCAGRKATMYVAYTEKSLKRAVDGLRKLGVPVGNEFSVPSLEEVQTGAQNTIPEIQGLTAALQGCKFDIELRAEPFYKLTNPGDYNSPKQLDEKGQPVITGYKIVADISNVKSVAVTSGGGNPF